MTSFLWWIGLYNLLGPLVLGAMHDERVANFVLRRATEVVAVPYEHGAFGRMWLWWAATTNGFVGAVMMLATRWPEAAQREVALCAFAVYAVLYVVLWVGGRGEKWGRGVPVVHGLWLAQLTWCAWGLWLA